MKGLRWVAMGCAGGFAVVALLVSLNLSAPWDLAGLRAMETIRTPDWTAAMLLITFLGGGDALGILAVLIGIGLWSVRGKRAGRSYLETVVIAYASYGLLKWAFGRGRPSVIPRLHDAGWYSFPSGHAMMSAVILGLAIMMVTERRLVRGAVGLLVLLIAFSRVYLGVHYPSDVIAGLLAGGAWISGMMGRFKAGIGPPLPVQEVDTPPVARTNDSGSGQ